MSLKVYNQKRKFNETPEPRGKVKKASATTPLRFVVQMHSASRLHWDFRLEWGGVFRSWAVPKGPSLNPLDQRLAVFVEDHPLDYGSFEGIIPPRNYGAGTVMLWDEGTYVERGSRARGDSEKAMAANFEKGHITFVLTGEKLHGEFALIKLKKDKSGKTWLLVKKRDRFSTTKRDQGLTDVSVRTGRTIDEIAAQAEKKGHVWLPKADNSKASMGAPKLKAPRVVPTSREGAAIAEALPRPPARKTARPTAASSVAIAPSAVTAPMPRKNKPMLPVRARALTEGEWLFEPSLGGVRALAEVEGKRVFLYSKSGLSYEKKFPEVVEELRSQKVPLVLDGEIVTLKGKSVYHVHDVLFVDGQDLRGARLRDRKRELTRYLIVGKRVGLVKSFLKPSLLASDEIIAKNAESVYRSGTTRDWLVLANDPQVFAKPRLKAKVTPEKITKAAKPAPSPARERVRAASALEEPRLTNLDKIFFPEEKITKGDLLEYYRSMSEYVVPYLKDRPMSLSRHPNGITGAGFYQKDMTGHIPRWLKTERIFSESSDKSIDYVVCQDERSLLYIANLGCIELHPWFSRVGSLEKPDFLVIDLDPDGNAFSHVVEIAFAVKEVLDAIGAPSVVKTSGATGIHIGVPTGAKHTFDEVRVLAEEICKIIAKKYPSTTSIDRNPNRRRAKIYLDFLQNRRGQTLASPYCVRPRAGAPVSMPLKWSELTKRIEPGQFHLKNALARVKKHGDPWAGIFGKPINLQTCLANLRRKYHKA